MTLKAKPEDETLLNSTGNDAFWSGTAVFTGAYCRRVLAIGPLTELSPSSHLFITVLLLRWASGKFYDSVLSILFLLCSLCAPILYSHDGVSSFLTWCLNLTRRGPHRTILPRCSLDGPWVASGLSAVRCLREDSIPRLIGRLRASFGSGFSPLLSSVPSFCIFTPITTPSQSENYYFGDRHSLDRMPFFCSLGIS